MLLQDAKKGVLFIDFPPVLQLQLKRFEYDFMRDTMVKVSTRKFSLLHHDQCYMVWLNVLLVSLYFISIDCVGHIT